MDDDVLQALLVNERYPRSGAYSARWMVENAMGPNPVWLTEALTGSMRLEPGMRVLDMGCGTALSSIFLAREFGVQVWATDLWVSPAENWARIMQAGVQDRVQPVHAEAHALPFAEGFFDALLSVDAYHYFGTDDLYIGYFSRFVKPGGLIGVIVPASPRNRLSCHRRAWNRTGNGTSAPGTARPGGNTTGTRPESSAWRSPTGYPRAGGTGCNGTRPATGTATRPVRKPTCSASMVAACSDSCS